MGKSIFHFKKFSVNQVNSAMKVCTDSCLFGASVKIDKDITKILDIGSGTGLLTLMLAQRTDAEIHAVEIENNAYVESKLNFEGSPWNERIKVFNLSIQEFSNISLHNQYDLIICNPPFFKNNLKSTKAFYNIAGHNESLSFHELIIASKSLIRQNGTLIVMLPAYETNVFVMNAIEEGFFLIAQQSVKNNTEAQVLREYSYFSLQKKTFTSYETIVIRDSLNNYSPEFIELLKNYYTIF